MKGSLGIPSSVAITLPVPKGITPMGISEPMMPATVSLNVPSPPQTATASYPSRKILRAASAASPGCLVKTM